MRKRDEEVRKSGSPSKLPGQQQQHPGRPVGPPSSRLVD